MQVAAPDHARLEAIEQKLDRLLAAVERLADARPPAGHIHEDERVMTMTGVCEALACGRNKVYDLIAEGHLDPIKIGRELRFPTAQVREVLRYGTSP